MFKKKNRSKKRTRAMLSAYSIIMILIIILGICSHLLPKAKYTVAPVDEEETSVEAEESEGTVLTEGLTEGSAEGAELEASETDSSLDEASIDEMLLEAETQSDDGDLLDKVVEGTPELKGGLEVSTDGTLIVSPEMTKAKEFDTLEACEEFYGEDGCAIVEGSGVEGAELYQILMSPILGFADAIDVCIFIMMLGGLLAVVARTKALETGIKLLVQKLHGKEYLLIVLLMFIFSILGTTYGFLEESVGFYVLIAATMFAAGLDPLVGVATILLGAGSGVLGSTINPFATGVALSAMKDAGIEYNQGTIILIAIVLWLTTLAIAAFFIIRYAKKVQRDKGSTFLSLREQAAAEKTYGKFLKSQNEVDKLSGKQIATLVIFAITFLVMIVGFVPWGEFGITFFDSWTGWLTGSSLGNWWFYEAALWFLLCAILIAIINRQGEHGFVDAFVDGADDMIGVALVIAVARGASVLMAETAMDSFIIVNAANGLASLPEMAFVPLNYLLHIVLSVLVPSSSGLATLSTPIIAPVAATLGYSTDVAAMTIVAANGLVNLITPTCGAIMGGLALAKVDYSTWFKWAIRVVAVIAIVNIVVLCLFSM